MKYLKYILLLTILWNIPSFFSYDEAIGSKFSFLMISLLLIYYFLCRKGKFILPFLILGLLYFIISGSILVAGDIKYFINDLIKYFVLIIAGAELARESSKKDLFVILVLGASSIFIHALLFQGDFGRYSGIYLDPNGAGFVCAMAYSLSFKVRPRFLKILGQLIVTFAGLLTFSRTFIILWFIVSLIATISDKKNYLNFVIGIGALSMLISVSAFFKVDNIRFNAITNLLINQETSSLSIVRTDSRLKTWSKYYEDILENPFYGNGYRQLSGYEKEKPGVHNAYLMVIGEGGFLPFLTFLGIYFYMLLGSFRCYKTESFKFMLAITLAILLLTTHNYFDNFIIIFMSLWLYIQISERSLSTNIYENNNCISDDSKLLNSKS